MKLQCEQRKCMVVATFRAGHALRVPASSAVGHPRSAWGSWGDAITRAGTAGTLRAPAPSGGQTLPPSDTRAQESHQGGIAAIVDKPSIAAQGMGWFGFLPSAFTNQAL